MRTIGLDVHKHVADVAILQPGAALQRQRITTDPEGLRAFAQTLRSDDEVVLEATMNTWAIVELLAERTSRVVISNPLRTKAIAEAKIKTDKVDAQTLAQLLQADFLPAVWIPDGPTRRLRRAVAGRAALVRQRTQLRNRVHAILLPNLVCAPMTDVFGVAGRRWLGSVGRPDDERAQLDGLLRLLGPLASEIAGCDRALAQAALVDPRALRLLTLPGVGATTALALVAVIGDITRFARPNKLTSYLGLDPKVRQSGDRPARTGHISRQGQAHARGLLIEAAQAAVRTPGPLRAFFRRVRARRGDQVAIVAVARKLVVLSWHLLSAERDYAWARPTLVGQKQRALERAVGTPRRRRGGPQPAGETVAERRAAEQARALEAEAASCGMVSARAKKTDAAATTGARR